MIDTAGRVQSGSTRLGQLTHDPGGAAVDRADDGAGAAFRWRSWVAAALFVLPYFLLGLAWIGSNPPGAAPDEADHLVKALGVARLDVGTRYVGPPLGTNLVAKRNVSISRVVRIPAALAPDGYKCTAFHPTESAACLPAHRPPGDGTVERVTPVGAYPPFLYLPLGVAAAATDSPVRAFLAARLAVLVISCALLLLGAAHLVSWLGRWALLGAFAGLTPMAVFSTSVVSTSGIEITSAFALAAAVVAATRRPESLTRPATQLLIAVSGSALVLSRQLGVVTLGVLLLVGAASLGRYRVWQLIREHRPAFLLSLAALAASVASVAAWELRFDNPSNTGPAFSVASLRAFDSAVLSTVYQGVGVFGWLDSYMPFLGLATWIMLVVLICGLAVLLACSRDRVTLLGVLAAALVTDYVIYAIIFFPVHAGVQGRHMLPMFVFLPLLAGVVVVERLHGSSLRDATPRLYGTVGVLVGALHFFGLYWNARRYAVGSAGSLFFFGREEWSPRFGWVPWLLAGAAGAVTLAAYAVRSRPDPSGPLPGMTEHVER
jgi:hypothetical protein